MMTITLNGVDVWRSVIELAIIGYLIYLSIYDIRHHKVTNDSVLLYIPIVTLKCTVLVCMAHCLTMCLCFSVQQRDLLSFSVPL